MQSFPPLLVADAGPLIALAGGGLLTTVARLIPKLVVPDAVLDECLVDLRRPDAKAVQIALDEGILERRATSGVTAAASLTDQLGRGESAAIALALAINAAILVDEKHGRRVARHLSLKIVGTGGLLIALKGAGLVPAVQPILLQLKTAGYWMSEALTSAILERCGER